MFDSRTDVPLFGLPRRKRHGAIEIRFAPSSSSADALLLEMIAEARDGQGTTVVTSDREIREAAVARGLRTAGAKEFWKALTEGGQRAGGGTSPEPRGKSGGISAAEADHWMKEFGLEEPGSP